MSITLEQSLIDLRAILHEHAPIYFGTPLLIDWLSQGQQDTAALTLGYQRRAVFTSANNPQALMVGVREHGIRLPIGAAGLGLMDHIKILHVFLNGDSLPLWTPLMLDQADPRGSAGGGQPAYWYEFARNIGFIPYPSTDFLASSWTLEVLYAAYPPDWTSGESVLPSGFDELPTYAASVLAHISVKRWFDAALAWQSFLSLTMEYRQLSLMRAATARAELKQPTRHERVDEPRRGAAMRR